MGDPPEACVVSAEREVGLAAIGSTSTVVCSDGVAALEAIAERGALVCSDEVDIAGEGDALVGPEVVMVVVANK